MSLFSDDLQQMVEARHRGVSQVRRGQVEGLLLERGQHRRSVRSPLLWPDLCHPGGNYRVLYQDEGRGKSASQHKGF